MVHRSQNCQSERMPIAEQPYMPEHGVGGPDWEPLPWSWAAERLSGYRAFWVVTSSPAGLTPCLFGGSGTMSHGFGFLALTRKGYNLRDLGRGMRMRRSIKAMG